MIKAKLEVLGLEVPTGSFKVYYDDGFVDSVEEHALELIDEYYPEGFPKKYRTDEIKSFHEDIARIGLRLDGVTMTLPVPAILRDHIHIFYLNNLSPGLTLTTRAHEETHALEELGHLDKLAEKILKEQRVKIDFREVDNRVMDWREIFGRVSDKEVRADIGAVYALHAHGIDPNQISTDVSFGIARDLYEEARLAGEQNGKIR